MADYQVWAATISGLFPVGTDSNNSSNVLFDGHSVTAIDGDYALIDRLELHRRKQNAPNAPNWELIADLGPTPALTVLDLGNGQVLAGTEQAHLTLISSDGTLRTVESFETAGDRDGWYTPWGAPADVRSLTQDANGNIFANVHVGGILRASDVQSSWEQTLDINFDVHQVRFDPRSGRTFAAAAVGLLETTDQGDNWTIHTNGMHATYARAVAVCQDTVFVSASTGPFTPKAAIYRRHLDDPGEFTICNIDSRTFFTENINTHNIATLDETVAIATFDGEVFASDDIGETWHLVGSGLPEVNALQITRSN